MRKTEDLFFPLETDWWEIPYSISVLESEERKTCCWWRTELMQSLAGVSASAGLSTGSTAGTGPSPGTGAWGHHSSALCSAPFTESATAGCTFWRGGGGIQHTTISGQCWRRGTWLVKLKLWPKVKEELYVLIRSAALFLYNGVLGNNSWNLQK